MPRQAYQDNGQGVEMEGTLHWGWCYFQPLTVYWFVNDEPNLFSYIVFPAVWSKQERSLPLSNAFDFSFEFAFYGVKEGQMDLDFDKLCERRADIQVRAENAGKGDECWTRLGVANRHLQRVSDGVFKLSPGIEREIVRCFEDVERWLS